MFMRTPLAYIFDRNCVLAATAGQLAAAHLLKVKIAGVIVGYSPWDVGFVAKDIRAAEPKPDAAHATVAAAGTIAFAWAAGRPSADAFAGLSGAPLAALVGADVILSPLVADGRLAALVRELDRFAIPGEWSPPDIAWAP